MPVSVRNIAAYEFRAALHPRGDRSDVAAQAVKFPNREDGAAFLAFLQSGGELGPVGVFLAALDFGVFGN